MMSPTLLRQQRCFGGTVNTYRHDSEVCGCPMGFAVYLPPQTSAGPLPVVYFLSGLTCTEENFMAKAGAQRYAAQLGLILVAPDTSPRGEAIPDADADDLGQGAGFYVNATVSPWRQHYRMEDYVVEELPRLIRQMFPIQGDRAGICGHSMGGHGALVLGLRHPDRYASISALAPIVAPSQTPWGQKAFRHYLGEDPQAWQAYDACELVKTHGDRQRPILIDQGREDPFLREQLCPERLAAACEAVGQPLSLRLQPGYDHSYYFVATFIEDHLRHHGTALSP